MRSEAIIKIHPEVTTINGDFEAWDKNGDLVTIDETKVEEEVKRLQADYDSKQYQRDRQVEYPDLPEQLDMLFHAIDAGALDKTSAFYTTLKAVKDKYPKG